MAKKESLSPIQVKEKMLKNYMRRQVSGMGTLIKDKAYASGIEPRELYRMLAENFGNPNGYYGENSPLDRIYRHMETDEGKNMAVYNYFDLDTLISYGKFLQRVLEDVNARASSKKRLASSDIQDSIRSSTAWLMKGKDDEKTWYYNPSNPIGHLRGEPTPSGRKPLAPESTMSMERFDAKYSEETCEEALDDYMEFGLEPGRIIRFEGRNYEIHDEAFYRSYPGDYTIRYVWGRGRTAEISGYIDDNNKPYFGTLHDMQGNYYNEADGVDVYERKNVPAVKKFNKLYRKSSAKTKGVYSAGRTNSKKKGGM